MKTPKPKTNRPTSVHSRAARRAEDGVTLSKALSPEPRASPHVKSPFRPDLTGSGVSKKKKTKQMTRAQRLRHQKGLERADVNVEKLSTKVSKSVAKSRVIKHRAAAWDELNQREAKPVAKKAKQSAPVEVVEDGTEVDNTLEDQLDSIIEEPTTAAAKAMPEVEVEDEDEIL